MIINIFAYTKIVRFKHAHSDTNAVVNHIQSYSKYYLL